MQGIIDTRPEVAMALSGSERLSYGRPHVRSRPPHGLGLSARKTDGIGAAGTPFRTLSPPAFCRASESEVGKRQELLTDPFLLPVAQCATWAMAVIAECKIAAKK
ncbi:MAG: hypothetical protein IAE97_12085 [Chthoniobacterales bacterium]|nr:hypothetical protein [Chthoniobacterales bacterium]